MIRALVLTLLLSCTLQASDIDLSKRKVEIRYDFKGSDLILFGAVKDADLTDPAAGYDIIVVVQGPNSDAEIRRKSRVNGIWMNKDSVTFTGVPGYYAVASSRELADFIEADNLKAQKIGFTNLKLDADVGADLANDLADFREGLYRQRAGTGLYRQDEGSVEIVGTHLFRTDINLPSHTPIGNFIINTYIVQQGQIVGTSELKLDVGKAGFERLVYDFAHQWPFLYGLTAVFIAFAAGWLAGVLGKK